MMDPDTTITEDKNTYPRPHDESTTQNSNRSSKKKKDRKIKTKAPNQAFSRLHTQERLTPHTKNSQIATTKT
jgi:hypothetical protein